MNQHNNASNLVYPWRSSLGFGGVLQSKSTTASSPHSHIVYHHWPLRNNEAKLSQVPVLTHPRDQSEEGNQRSKPHARPTEGHIYLSTNAAPKSPARGEWAVAGC